MHIKNEGDSTLYTRGVSASSRNIFPKRVLTSVVKLATLSIIGFPFTSSLAIAQATTRTTIEEIVISAQRRDEALSDVPMSVTAMNQEVMDQRNIVSIDDVSKVTPGITFRRADTRNAMASSIAIRGIQSNAGSSTTGIYIDDTPIQSRSLGYSSFNTFPQIFDLERVEVLRGPQGTLFGAGSEGGTVRFITPRPGLTESSGYVRAEGSTLDGGGESYEVGAAYGAPLIEDVLGFRVSAWTREDAGWVDRVNWTRTTPPVATEVVDEDANEMNSEVLKAALAWTPADNLEISTSVYYQHQEIDSNMTFWADLSDPDDGKFYSGAAQASPSEDEFYLYSLDVEWDLGAAVFTSNTTYFDRENSAINDYTSFEAGIWAGNPYYPEGVIPASAHQYNAQENLSQEFKLQGYALDDKLTWVVGTFLWRAEQTAKQLVENQSLPDLIPVELIFGQGLVDGRYTFVADPIMSEDKEIAIFAQVDYNLTDKLTLTAGLRYSDTTVEANADYEGPVVGPTVSDAGKQEESTVNPKLGLEYAFNDDNMMYASAARGYRIGGYNPRVGLPCTPDLNNLGLDGTPEFYDSDSVWSYEVGAKNTLADGTLSINSSVYYVDWQDIQQNVGLPCGFQFVGNLGSATSTGFDVQLDYFPTESLMLNLALGYTNTEYDETVKAGPAAVFNLVTEGDKVPLWPVTASLAARYDFTAFGNESYLRMDYLYQSEQDDVVPGLDPANGPVNNVFSLPETHELNARLGVRYGNADIALFAKNLLNEATVLSQGVAPGPITLEEQSAMRPRTIGVSLNAHF